VCGILIGNLYAPNGNPWPGPKFDYKLAWMDRLHEHARACSTAAAGAADRRLQRHPDRQDVYKPERWAKDALVLARGAEKFASWSRRAGPTRSASSTRRAHLHLLALLAELVPARRRHPHRPCAAEPERWPRSSKAAGVDRTPRGWEKTSDHAPMWVESFDTLRTLECPACLPAEDAVDVRYLPIHPLSPIQQDRLSSGDGIVLRVIHADPPRTGAVGEIAVRDVG
jgi:hypothetical protein